MRRPAKRSQASGFTLIELLISTVIFLLIQFGVYMAFDTNRALFASGSRKADVQQQLRAALDVMARQIRMAGYYPEQFDADPATNPSLATPIRVLAGTESGLVVYGDLDNSDASNAFLFCLSGTSVVRKRTTDPAAAAALTCDGGDVLARNITGLRFTYYTQDSVPLPNPTGTTYRLDNQALGVAPDYGTTTQRGAVRTVVIAMTANETVPIPGKGPQVLTLNASIRLRNP